MLHPMSARMSFHSNAMCTRMQLGYVVAEVLPKRAVHNIQKTKKTKKQANAPHAMRPLPRQLDATTPRTALQLVLPAHH